MISVISIYLSSIYFGLFLSIYQSGFNVNCNMREISLLVFNVVVQKIQLRIVSHTRTCFYTVLTTANHVRKKKKKKKKKKKRKEKKKKERKNGSQNKPANFRLTVKYAIVVQYISTDH